MDSKSLHRFGLFRGICNGDFSRCRPRNENFTSETDGIPLGEKIPWEEALPDPSKDPTVYVTKSGTKYHLSSDCSGLKRAKEIIKSTLSAATEDGKELCKICEG